MHAGCDLTLIFPCAGEFEPHVGCWMGWPESEDSPYLWREGGEPARQAYGNVARAISQVSRCVLSCSADQPEGLENAATETRLSSPRIPEAMNFHAGLQ